MPPRISELVGDSRLGLTVLGGGDALKAPIRWVATSEHEDPTPFLQGGELLLTTGMRLPRTRKAVGAYVERLVAAGVVGLGFGVGLVHQRTPKTLVDSAVEAGLVLVEVAEPTPFVAISKRVSDLLAAEHHAEVTWANKAQQELTRTAVREGAPAVVRKLSRLLDSWVAELDGWGQVVHLNPRSAQANLRRMAGELDRVRQKGFASASIVHGGEHLSVHQLGTSRPGHGLLLVGSARALSVVERSLVTVATALLSFERAHSMGADAANRQAAVLGLARDGAVTEPATLRLLGCPLLARRALWVVCAAGPATERRNWLEGLQGLGPDRLMSTAGGQVHNVVLGSEPDLALARAGAERLSSVRLGVAGPADDGAAGLGRVFEEAGRALRRAIQHGLPLATYADLMSGATSVGAPDDAVAFARQLLAPLRDYASRTGHDLEPTLTVWLRHHGLFEPAAAELGVHRHTLRNRVARAQQLLDRDLGDVDGRMDLWYALRVVHSG